MKNTLLLIAVLLVGACAATPTMKSVAGTYERIEDGDTYRGVFLENGILEQYRNGKKKEGEGKWKISKDSELHIDDKLGAIPILTINPDGSLTVNSISKGGKRIDVEKWEQITFKKIK